jgi:hypothetical protein
MNRPVSLFLVFLLAVFPLTAVPVLALDENYKGSLGEGKHERYVPPVSNPFLNETPYITTEIRPVIIHNDVPRNVLANTPFAPGAPGGGHLNVLAIQMRFALSERLGIIFNKNGLMDFNHTDGNSQSDTGLANFSFGIKYAMISDPEKERLVTAGITYEIPSGTLTSDTFRLQGDGRGFINTFVTAADSYNKLGVQGMLGVKLSLDGERNVSWFNYSFHVDYEILPDLFPLVEVNGFVPIIEDTRQNSFRFEGLDLVSIGGSDPEFVTTFAVGSRYRFNKNVLAGVAYEVPLTEDKDIMDWRVTGDLVIYY